MQIFRDVSSLTSFLDSEVWSSQKLGLVPTMGAIHEGHLSLVKASVAACDFTIASIFVNPAQFNNPEDLEKYPRQEGEDLSLLESVGCDAVFLPEANEMYPEGDYLQMNFGLLERVMEGEFRPGHFSGVGIIVSKLFNIIRPQVAYFGQKDLQQVAVINKLVKDLNFPVTVETMETMREKTGLAMSSRNMRLSTSGEKKATVIYTLMNQLKNMVDEGKPLGESKSLIEDQFSQTEGVDLEYLEVVDSDSLISISDLSDHSSVSVCVAAHVEGVRLIDNMYLKQQG